jgi:hypothetical protein
MTLRPLNRSRFRRVREVPLRPHSLLLNPMPRLRLLQLMLRPMLVPPSFLREEGSKKNRWKPIIGIPAAYPPLF